MDVNTDVYEILLEQLQCPICLAYMTNPILLCLRGHSICATCRSKTQACLLCAQSFSTTRNIALEQIADKIAMPCYNESLGCVQRVTHQERNDHEKICEYQQLNCAIATCNWRGSLNNLKPHYSTEGHCLFKTGLFELTLTHNYVGCMIEAVGEMFWFKQCIMPHKIYWAVQYIGNKEDAANYVFAIEFSDRNGRKIAQFQDRCQSVFIQDVDLFNEQYCISVDEHWLKHFCGCVQLLHCCVTIEKE